MILDVCGTHLKLQCHYVIHFVCVYARACVCTCGAQQVFPLGDPAVPESDPTDKSKTEANS